MVLVLPRACTSRSQKRPEAHYFLESGRSCVKNLLMIAVLAVAGCLMLAACADPKARSEEAIKIAENALNPVKAEAVKYIPEQIKALEDKIAAAKAAVAKGDFPAASLYATEVVSKVKEIPATAQAKKEELTRKWAEISASVPMTVEQLAAKIVELSKLKKLPAGMDKEKLETARADVNEVGKLWAEAEAAAKEGKLSEAVAKSGAVKEKAAAAMALLGLSQ